MADVTGARISLIGSAATPGQLNTSGIGQPGTYRRALLRPSSFTGLGVRWALPWGTAKERVAPDHFFWESWVDRSNRMPDNLDDAYVIKLLNRGIPLRNRCGTPSIQGTGPLTVGTATAELFLHPWAVHMVMTFDCAWAPAVSIQQAGNDVDHFLALAVGSIWPTAPANRVPLLEAPEASALAIAGRLGGSHDQPVWPSCVCIATVTEGDPGTPLPTRFFTPLGATHEALHKLAHGPSALPSPPTALLPVNDGVSGKFDPSQIRYLLKDGLAQWFGRQLREMPATVEERVGSQHRFGVLQIVQVRGCHALTDIWEKQSPGGWIAGAHDGVVKVIRRRYGPQHLEEGFVIQGYCDRVGLASSLDIGTGPPAKKFNPPFPTAPSPTTPAPGPTPPTSSGPIA